MVKFYFIYFNLLHILDEKTTEIKLLNIMKVGFSLFIKSSFFYIGNVVLSELELKESALVRLDSSYFQILRYNNYNNIFYQA